MSGSAFLTLRTATRKVRVFVSYDREHDADLLERLAEQASRKTATFEISAGSMPRSSTDLWDDELRSSIREAEQVIVLCGEHTDRSGRVGAELRIAQEEERPYLLLWGRRDPMCKKPGTARPADSMYSWTPEVLHTQIATLRRLAETDARSPGRGADAAPAAYGRR